MADMSALREQLRQRAAELVETASSSIEEQLRTAAGPALPPDALVRGDVQINGSDVSVTVSAEGEGATIWEWSHNHEPPGDFDPHVALDGVAFDETNWREVLAKDPGEFPEGNEFYYPQDHSGCFCSAEVLLGNLVFDPFNLDAQPQVISAFGVDILVNPAAPATVDEVPEWWSQVLTSEAWSQALADAQ